MNTREWTLKVSRL